MGEVPKSELEEKNQANMFKDVGMTVNKTECEPQPKKKESGLATNYLSLSPSWRSPRCRRSWRTTRTRSS